ncbi:RHS repeat-associated core domain-containing protein [Arcanobacterium phocae]|uniref:RHS repeat-associated core domain-containing protein n=1 Tax=Arcanobacterium phocae TaxID=131112 RepID=UPI0012FCF148|nr:RHS repeat-associated core domain-containing protein [Arcanobacterium phocae]
MRLDNPYQVVGRLVPGLPEGLEIGSGSIHIHGLAWLRARVYDPTTYSFLTRDPLPAYPGVVWEANPYNYAANNPLSLSDPLGLKPVTDQELAAYNNTRSTSLWHKVKQNGLSWENAVGVGAMIVGGALMFTGVGAGFGGAGVP